MEGLKIKRRCLYLVFSRPTLYWQRVSEASKHFFHGWIKEASLDLSLKKNDATTKRILNLLALKHFYQNLFIFKLVDWVQVFASNEIWLNLGIYFQSKIFYSNKLMYINIWNIILYTLSIT